MTPNDALEPLDDAPMKRWAAGAGTTQADCIGGIFPVRAGAFVPCRGGSEWSLVSRSFPRWMMKQIICIGNWSLNRLPEIKSAVKSFFGYFSPQREYHSFPALCNNTKLEQAARSFSLTKRRVNKRQTLATFPICSVYKKTEATQYAHKTTGDGPST